MHIVRQPPAVRALSTSPLKALVLAPVGGMYVGSVKGSVLLFGAMTEFDTPRLIMKRPLASCVYTPAPFGAARVHAVMPNLSLMNFCAASMSAVVPFELWLCV